MARPFALGALSLGRFRPSVHLYPPLVLLSCLVASTAAPAAGRHGQDVREALQELRELRVPGFGASPDHLIGAGGVGLANPDTGRVVPTFEHSVVPAGPSNDGFVVPPGFSMARSGAAPAGSGFGLTSPPSFRGSGTASPVPPVLPPWQADSLFDSDVDGATGDSVPFRILSTGSSESEGSPNSPSDLPIAAEPADEDPDQQDGGELFRTALLPEGDETPQATPSDDLHSALLPSDSDDAPAGEGPAPASVPGPLPLAGVAVAWRCSRRLRQRLRQAR